MNNNVRRKETVGRTSLSELDQMIKERKRDEMPEDTKELRKLVIEKLPKIYHDYMDVLSKAEAHKMAPHRPYDHKIVLDAPQDFNYSPLYKMSTAELEEVRSYLKDNLDKGFIVSSKAPFASPVLFVLKKDGALRFCVDYRKLNSLTKKDQYPLPLIDETLARLARCKIMTKLDIQQHSIESGWTPTPKK